jgi:D-sedoheptulose 7-phosphate isomerase
MNNLNHWLNSYVAAQKRTLDSIPLEGMGRLIATFQKALAEDRQIFTCGNGGSAANASHFATDLGKGSSNATETRFRILSLNDNVAWMTALANDHTYEDVFVRQLENYARPADILLVMSVSGNSPNVVKAVRWGVAHDLHTIALVGGKGGQLADIANDVIMVNSVHFGQVEDAHMGICHMLSYAFMEVLNRK